VSAGPSAGTCQGSANAVLRLVNSRRIAFHFEVKDGGGTSPVTVEIWGTQDLKTWQKYDPVAQKDKAYIIEVKEEGLYGFALLAHSAASRDRPRPGEVPQVWVAVDYTRPEVHFAGAELNILAPAPTLVIRWAASDRNLGPRPITLLYAEQSDGPWTLLAGNADNTGRYEWALPTTLPSSLYLRVQAADLMGNIGMAQTPNLLTSLRAAAVVTPHAVCKLPVQERSGVCESESARPRRLLPTPALQLKHLPSAGSEPARAEANIVTIESERGDAPR
jgi:hypothetical protein